MLMSFIILTDEILFKIDDTSTNLILVTLSVTLEVNRLRSF